MNQYREDIDLIIRMERYFGPLSRTLKGGFSVDKVNEVKGQFVSLLQKYKQELGIKSPLPNIRIWNEEDKVNFLFFDKNSGKRILLGEWLEGKEIPYEQ